MPVTHILHVLVNRACAQKKHGRGTPSKASATPSLSGMGEGDDRGEAGAPSLSAAHAARRGRAGEGEAHFGGFCAQKPSMHSSSGLQQSAIVVQALPVSEQEPGGGASPQTYAPEL